MLISLDEINLENEQDTLNKCNSKNSLGRAVSRRIFCLRKPEATLLINKVN